MNKQCIFLDSEGNVCVGIYVKDLDGIICGCCGGLVSMEDAVVLHWFNEWLDIQSEICGDYGELREQLEDKINAMTPEQVQAILDGKKDFNA